MKNIDAVIQYLDWAMLAAHAESSPDCSQVVIQCDLDRRTTTTSFVIRGSQDEKRPMLVTLREATVLRDLCNRHIADLKGKIDRCAGSLYPGIFASQIDEIEALFKKLTGFPLNDPDEEA